MGWCEHLNQMKLNPLRIRGFYMIPVSIMIAASCLWTRGLRCSWLLHFRRRVESQLWNCSYWISPKHHIKLMSRYNFRHCPCTRIGMLFSCILRWLVILDDVWMKWLWLTFATWRNVYWLSVGSDFFFLQENMQMICILFNGNENYRIVLKGKCIMAMCGR